MRLDKVVFPITFKVSLRFAAPVASSVPVFISRELSPLTKSANSLKLDVTFTLKTGVPDDTLRANTLLLLVDAISGSNLFDLLEMRVFAIPLTGREPIVLFIVSL